MIGESRSACSAVVIGTSAGGMKTLRLVFGRLPANFPVPVLVVQHMGQDGGRYLPEALERDCRLRIELADDKQNPQPGTVYFAPPGYHLLVEHDATLALSVDERVHYARPSIDVLFESAAEVFRKSVVGVVLTGASADGAAGLWRIHQLGGCAIVQTPASAEISTMPEQALCAVPAAQVLDPIDIGKRLMQLCDAKLAGGDRV